MTFDILGLDDRLTRAVRESGYEKMTPIQTKAIPAVLNGNDILAGAQTGTGKTAAFALPVLQTLLDRGKPQRKPRVLVLAPTRELAAQLGDSFSRYGRYVPYRTATVFGGVNIKGQISRLRQGVDILVATPGRLLDLVSQRAVDLTRVQVFVLDEADRMLDMGFIHDINRILKLLSPVRQNLMFSATYNDDMRSLASSFLVDPTTIDVAPRNTTAQKIEQAYYEVEKERKAALLCHLIREESWYQVLVFTRTKHGANRLAKQLTGQGITAEAIHGNKSQAARTRALSEFKTGNVQVLVATDIAARGLDIERLSHVVNYDIPQVPEDYVHRIGRTGRAGESGRAISFVSSEEAKLLRAIQKLTKIRLREIEDDKIQPLQKPIVADRPHTQPEQARKNRPPRSKRSSGSNRRPTPSAGNARRPR